MAMLNNQRVITARPYGLPARLERSSTMFNFDMLTNLRGWPVFWYLRDDEP